jgi:hypothetical protein
VVYNPSDLIEIEFMVKTLLPQSVGILSKEITKIVCFNWKQVILNEERSKRIAPLSRAFILSAKLALLPSLCIPRLLLLTIQIIYAGSEHSYAHTNDGVLGFIDYRPAKRVGPHIEAKYPTHKISFATIQNELYFYTAFKDQH